MQSLGGEDIRPAHDFTQAQPAAQFLFEPGLNGKVGLRVVGNDEHIRYRTAVRAGQRRQVKLRGSSLNAGNGGDLCQAAFGHPDMRRDAHQQCAFDFGFGTFRHHHDIGAQPVDRQAQAVLRAAHQQRGKQSKCSHQ